MARPVESPMQMGEYQSGKSSPPLRPRVRQSLQYMLLHVEQQGRMPVELQLGHTFSCPSSSSYPSSSSVASASSSTSSSSSSSSLRTSAVAASLPALAPPHRVGHRWQPVLHALRDALAVASRHLQQAWQRPLPGCAAIAAPPRFATASAGSRLPHNYVRTPTCSLVRASWRALQGAARLGLRRDWGCSARMLEERKRCQQEQRVLFDSRNF